MPSLKKKQINNQKKNQFARWLIAKYLLGKRKLGWKLRAFNVIQKRFYKIRKRKSKVFVKSKLLLKKNALELRKNFKRLEIVAAPLKKREKLFIVSANKQIHSNIKIHLNRRVSNWISWSMF